MLVVAVVLVVVAGDLVVLVEACTHGEVVPDRVFKPLCALRLHKGEPSPDKGVDLCGAQGAFLARVQRQRNQAGVSDVNSVSLVVESKGIHGLLFLFAWFVGEGGGASVLLVETMGEGELEERKKCRAVALLWLLLFVGGAVLCLQYARQRSKKQE